MTELNVFKGDGFSTMSMTVNIDEFDYVPSMLGGMNLFDPKPVTSKDIFIESRDNTNTLLGLRARGAPLQQHERGNRKKVSFEIPKIGNQETIWGHELAGLRAFGSETEEMKVMEEVATRLASQKQDHEYTKEYMRLAAVQGKFLDPADGSVVYDYFTEFGITPVAEVAINLSAETTKVKQIIEQIVIDTQRRAKGAWVVNQTKLHAIVGDEFWFKLTQHSQVEKYFDNWPAMAALKDLSPTDTFEFGGVMFHRYIGSDDNSEIAVAPTEAKFFPVGARDTFTEARAPADEWIEFVGTKGLSTYAIKRTDNEYETPRWVGYDVVSYPLFMCNRPNLLSSAVAT